MSVERALMLLLAEQRKTNELLGLLIQAMAEDNADPDDEPATYLDGTPICR